MNIDIKTLREQGIYVARQMVDSTLIDEIKNEVNQIFDENNPEKLGSSINIAALKPEHLTMYEAEQIQIQKEYINFHLTREQFAQGCASYRHITNGRSITQPLINLPSAWKLIKNYPFYEISSEYFEQKSKLGFVKTRRYFVNNLPKCDTSLFHYDDNSTHLLKAIMYLNDIDINGGPFVYVPESHNNIVSSTQNMKYSRNDDEVETYYGKDAIHYITGKRGDVIFVNTLGIHRGNHPKSQDRNVLFLNFVLKPEYEGKGPKLKLKRENYNQLNDEQKSFVEFLEII